MENAAARQGDNLAALDDGTDGIDVCPEAELKVNKAPRRERARGDEDQARQAEVGDDDGNGRMAPRVLPFRADRTLFGDRLNKNGHADTMPPEGAFV